PHAAFEAGHVDLVTGLERRGAHLVLDADGDGCVLVPEIRYLEPVVDDELIEVAQADVALVRGQRSHDQECQEGQSKHRQSFTACRATSSRLAALPPRWRAADSSSLRASC